MNDTTIPYFVHGIVQINSSTAATTTTDEGDERRGCRAEGHRY